MAGTKAGGVKTREIMIKKHGSEKAWKDHMRKLGSVGGAISRGGGFGEGEEGRDRARKYGAVGGRISRRRRKEKSFESVITR